MTRAELLSAYLDGALDEAQQEAFERDLADDPALAEELARLLDNDRDLRTAIAAAAGDDSAEMLAARYGLTSSRTAKVAAAANENHRWRWVSGLTVAAAAAAAALLFLAPGSLAPGSRGQPTFDEALDRTPSLERARLADGRFLVPRLTVRTAEGTYCREFRLGDDRAAQQGLACRAGERWRVLVEAPGVPSAPTGDIVLAGVPASPALEAAYARLKASDPLGASAERDLIARRWAAGKSATPAE